jgi:hypothetical protein
MLQALLGLAPDAFKHRLDIVRPTMPKFVDRVTLTDLRVGDASVDLRFERDDAGMGVEVDRLEGDLEVAVRGER